MLAWYLRGQNGSVTFQFLVGNPGEPLWVSEERNEVWVGKRVAKSPRDTVKV